MMGAIRKLNYGTRLLLGHKGEKAVVDVVGTPTQVRRGGEGPPMVYLHSAIGETVWLPFMKAWSGSFTVYAPAHPGYAESKGLDQIRDIEDLAFHYINLLDTLGLDQLFLGGVSLGGWLALEIACRWPERVSRLWIADAPGLWLDEHPITDLFLYQSQPIQARELLFHDPESTLAKSIIKDPNQLNEETKLAIQQSMTLLTKLMWERPYNPRLAKRLHRVRCPVLILWGEQDRLIPAIYAHAFQKLLPKAQIHIIPECGHLPMFEQEDRFEAAIRSFCLDRIPE